MANTLSKSALPGNSLPEMISPYIANLIEQTGGIDGPIGKQFIANQKFKPKPISTLVNDPQQEQLHECAPGLIYKYKGKIKPSGEVDYYGRGLWIISRYCATYCRFCFRGRMVGLPHNSKGTTNETLSQKPYLNDSDITQVIQFIKSHPELNEIILSGGDPLITPPKYLTKIISALMSLQLENYLDIIRIHSRAPITNPDSIKPWHLSLIKTIKNPYIVLHINHPAEITPQVVKVITNLKNQTGAMLLSQSVLLKGVNDNLETLQLLFNKLVKNGIHPYYLHYNDPVSWATDFTVPMPEAITLWAKLRPRLSGIAASAKFVIDTPLGHGKVPLPDMGWNVDTSTFYDYNNIVHKLE